MGRLILVLGGARSGKSSFAQNLAQAMGDDHVLFVATAEALDEEMRDRIALHRQDRPPAWRTLEAPRTVGDAIARAFDGESVVLLDCLTLLVSNAMLPDGEELPFPEAQAAVAAEVTGILRARDQIGSHFIVVSNEVGMGLVPPYPLGRHYRDLLGRANQDLARHADAVYLLVAGLPLELKELASRTDVGRALCGGD